MLVALQLLNQELALHSSIADRGFHFLAEVQQVLLARPESPLGETISSLVVDEVGISTIVYLASVRLVRQTESSFEGLLQIIGLQTRLCINVTDHTSLTCGSKVEFIKHIPQHLVDFFGNR